MPNHRRGRETTSCRYVLRAQPLLQRVDVYLVFGHDAQRSCARQERAQRLSKPFEVEAVRTPVNWIFGATVRILKASFDEQRSKPRAHVRTAGTRKELIEHLHRPVTQRRRRPCAVRYREIILMKHGEPARLEHTGTTL